MIMLKLNKKLVGLSFLIVILFLVFLFKQDVLAISCVDDSACDFTAPYCINGICSACASPCPDGYFCDDSTKACESFCKDQPGTVYKNGHCVIPEDDDGGSSSTSKDSVKDVTSSELPFFVPKGDPRCWKRQDCINERKRLGVVDPKDAEGGFYSAREHTDALEACASLQAPGEDWGFCLPASQTITKIKFGGETNFSNIAKFIQYMYKYAITAAGILAVVFIMIAGFEWLTSGGNVEQISKARKRIGNALMGLFLAVCSYLILNLINPYLVNLRLPQTWLIRSNDLTQVAGLGSFCMTAGPLRKDCESLGKPGEYVCRPFHRDGAGLIAGDTFLALAVMVLDPTGGAASRPGLIIKGIEGTGKLIGRGTIAITKKYTGFFFTTPAKKLGTDLAILFGKNADDLAKLSAKEVEKIVVEEVKKDTTKGALNLLRRKVVETATVAQSTAAMGLKAAGGAVVGGTVGYFGLKAGAHISEELWDLLKDDHPEGYPGICDRSHKLPDGHLCNAINPEDCISGKCVNFNFVGGWVRGVDLGVCSSGGFRDPCKDESDCVVSGMRCIHNNCSDRSQGAYCETDADCDDSTELICNTRMITPQCFKKNSGDVGDRCLYATGGEDTSGKVGGCKKGLDCINIDVDGSPLGYCTDHVVGSPCYTGDKYDCKDESGKPSKALVCIGSTKNNKLLGVCGYPSLAVGASCVPGAKEGEKGSCGSKLDGGAIPCVCVGTNCKCSKGLIGQACASDRDCSTDVNKVGPYRVGCFVKKYPIDTLGKCSYFYFSNFDKDSRIGKLPNDGDPVGSSLCTDSLGCTSQSICGLSLLDDDTKFCSNTK